jgi:hypothetical protein
MNDYLEEVERQLVALTERGAHRRRRLPAGAAGIAGAVVVTVAVIAVIAGLGSGPRRQGSVGAGHRSHHVQRQHRSTPVRHHPPAPVVRTRTRSVTARTGGPVPPGFAPQSFTAIGELSWWLLGSAPCSSPPCTSIVRTNDGGRTFAGIPAPRTSKVSQLAFGDSADGYAYGPELWVTHDGGAHWRTLSVGGSVDDLAITSGFVYAVARDAQGNGRLERSPVSADEWQALPAAGNVAGGLWVQASDVLVESTDNHLLVSSNRGSSFTRYRVPPSVACSFQSPAPPVIWEHCATGMMSGTWRSSDFGRTYAPASGGHGWPGPELPNSAPFAAATATTALEGWQQLYRTTDGGASWQRVAAPPGITQWQYLGFSDPTHGAGIALSGSHRQLYYTTDGGASYHLVAIR